MTSVGLLISDWLPTAKIRREMRSSVFFLLKSTVGLINFNCVWIIPKKERLCVFIEEKEKKCDITVEKKSADNRLKINFSSDILELLILNFN